jgi:hypothetical protein
LLSRTSLPLRFSRSSQLQQSYRICHLHCQRRCDTRLTVVDNAAAKADASDATADTVTTASAGNRPLWLWLIARGGPPRKQPRCACRPVVLGNGPNCFIALYRRRWCHRPGRPC